MDELVGKNLGQYEIRSMLGKGGMSSVYLAYQPSMDRQVAIKLLPPEFLHDDTFLTRFQQECRVVARLEHLHILPVYDVGEQKGIPYIVMRYLQGGTLSDLIAKGTLEARDAARYISQIADALDFAHHAGVIHRDMKPSNILLDENKNAFLADFGIARLAASHASLTGSRIIGTPPYIAPEMVHKGQEVTYLSDIYALGVIAFEMLTGQPPYVDADPMKVLMMHVMEPVPSPRALKPSVGIAVDSVIRRCLAKTASERYQSASAFARAFNDAASMESETIPVPTEESKGVNLGEVSTIRTPSPGEGMAMALSETGEHQVPPTPMEKRTRGRTNAKKSATKGKLTPEKKQGCRMRWLVVVLAVIGALAVGVFILSRLGQFAENRRNPTPAPGDLTTPTLGASGLPGAKPIPLSEMSIAFASNRDGDYDIYVINADGGDALQLTDNDTYDFDPDWAPDGNQIVYASDESGNSEIMIMGKDGANPRAVTDNPAKDADPAWSPDGRYIAFSSNRDGDFDLYLIKPDGSDLQQITFNETDDLSPSWSPDGKRLIYYNQPGEDESKSEIFIYQLDGNGEPKRMTSNTWLDKWPAFAPLGNGVVFTSSAGLPAGQRALFISRNESDSRQLTTGEARDDDPAWSPDGRYIAYDSDLDGDSTFDLFLIEVETHEITRLTLDAANDVAPAWRPIR